MENEHEEDESTDVTDRQLMEANELHLKIVKEVLTLLIQVQSPETKSRLRSYVERFGEISPEEDPLLEQVDETTYFSVIFIAEALSRREL